MSRRLLCDSVFCLAIFSCSLPVSAQPVPGDDSTFIRDETFEDGVKVKPGQELIKKWLIRNTGSVTWENRYLVAVESTAGEPDRKAIKRSTVPLTKPGEKCNLEATLTAPMQYGRYKVTFKMVDPEGKQYFPNKKHGVYVDVIVE